MRVHHEARGGRVTERFAVELEGRHMEAISDLYLSLFNTDEARQSALGEAFWAIHKEWKADNDPTLFTASVPGDGHVVSHAPISNGGSPE